MPAHSFDRPLRPEPSPHVEPSPYVESVCVPHERGGVGFARHALSDELQARGVDGPTREDAVLVLSELVTNAIKHAAPLPSGEIRVRWSIDDDCLHLEITDGGAVTRPHAGVADISSLGGRGLDIVRHVSDQWGVKEDQDCVTVWADVRPKPDTSAVR